LRVLVSLEGPREGGTRAALGRLSLDELRLLATDPGDERVQRVGQLAERFGAPVHVREVPAQDLMGAFDVIQATLANVAQHDVVAQINAGPDANLLSAAGMLVCLHEGVPMHFLHEEGHTPLPVFTEIPVEPLLSDDEREQLLAVPDEGIELAMTDDHDEAALNGLKDEDLVQPREGRLVLTERGRAYREHSQRRPDREASPD
jgi:hypothetical protein